VELPAKASVHINMQQDFTQRAAEPESLRDQAYGGFFIRAENPTARILVKEHIFSLSKQVASPYYGSVHILISHHIQSYPPQMVVGQNSTAQTMTCYYSGCYWNGWQISSFHPTIVSTQWLPGWVPRPITAHQPGTATLYSSAQGPINQYGDQGWKDDAVIISVYDATPVINAIVPNTIPAGGSQIAEIYGLNFGANPQVSATGGIQTSILYASPTQINVQFSAPATPPGNYNVWVTSNGFSGSGFLQAPGGGSQAQSAAKPASTVCPFPTGESTASYGWADSAGHNAIHNFLQTLQPTPTSQPTGASFAGRRVRESNAAPAADGCHFSGSLWPKVDGISGGEWLVGSSNTWGIDSVGPTNDVFFYYQQQRPIRSLSLPCHIDVFQRMEINTCDGSTVFTSYKTPILLKTIISSTGVTIGRDTVTVTRQLQ
jgi:hypothetical protein